MISSRVLKGFQVAFPFRDHFTTHNLKRKKEQNYVLSKLRVSADRKRSRLRRLRGPEAGRWVACRSACQSPQQPRPRPRPRSSRPRGRQPRLDGAEVACGPCACSPRGVVDFEPLCAHGHPTTPTASASAARPRSASANPAITSTADLVGPACPAPRWVDIGDYCKKTFRRAQGDLDCERRLRRVLVHAGDHLLRRDGHRTG